MTFLISTCEFPDQADMAAGMWRRLAIEIGQTFALADARKAHEALESRATIGASLLIP